MFQVTNLLFNKPKKSREQVNRLVAAQWQRERAALANLIAYNNPLYAKTDKNATQL